MAGEKVSFDEEGKLGKAYDARLIRRLLGYVAPHRGKMALAVALIVLSSLLQLGGPLITAVALDLFVRPLNQEVETSRAAVIGQRLLESGGWELTPVDGVGWAAVSYFVLLAVTLVVLYGQASVMQVMGQLIMSDLRREVFSHLQRLDVAYLDGQPVGRLVTRVTTDVDALNELFTAGFVSIFGDVVLLAGIVGVLFWMDWKLALVTFSVLPLLLILTFWFKTRARRAFREVRVRIAKINAFLQEHLSGMTVVQLFGGERVAYERFQGVNRDHRDANVRAILYYAVYFPAVELLTALGVALILWYGGGQVIQGAVSMGALVAFLQYSQRFYQPLADLSEKYNILQAAMASSERIFQLVDTEAEITAPQVAYCPDEMKGELELKGVFFAYRPGTWVLEDVSFRVAPGERVAFGGHTGAGKSTLWRASCSGSTTRNRGALLVDGVDVRRWDLPTLRRRIALVLQDVFLFSGDVESNVALGRESVSLERTRWALRELGCLDLLEKGEGASAGARGWTVGWGETAPGVCSGSGGRSPGSWCWTRPRRQWIRIRRRLSRAPLIGFSEDGRQ